LAHHILVIVADYAKTLHKFRGGKCGGKQSDDDCGCATRPVEGMFGRLRVSEKGHPLPIVDGGNPRDPRGLRREPRVALA
jgi:hypothetical protein